MQTIRFSSSINGVCSFKDRLVVGTEKDGLFIININKSSIENQYPIPSHLIPNGSPVWTIDGDCIFFPTGKTLQFIKPSQNNQFIEVSLPENINQIFQHPKGDSIIAVLMNNSLYHILPNEKQDIKSFYSYLPTEQIISILSFNKFIYTIIESEKSHIDIFDPNNLTLINSILIPQRSSSISKSFCSSFGILIIYSDGFWVRYNDEDIFSTFGSISTGKNYYLLNSYLAVSLDKTIKIYDLKFDAELQEIPLSSNYILLFSNKLISINLTNLDIREWHGINQTTTKDLIGSMKSINKNTEEINIELEYIENSHQPSLSNVITKTATFKYKSLRHIIESIMEEKFVTEESRKVAINLLELEKEDDIKDLALFHLSTTISFTQIINIFEKKKFDTVSLMLKKIQTLNSEQLVHLLRIFLNILSINDICLSHLLMQPHSDEVIIDSIKTLNSNEINDLLLFLSKLLKSRRKWRDFDASLTALDMINKWSSLIIFYHKTNLIINNLFEGLKKLKFEFEKEKELIFDASQCWSILSNINEDKPTNMPPTFMYLVETLPIPE